MKENKISTQHLTICAMTAALYTAICLVAAPLSFGLVQIRFSEALTLLPVFSPVFIWGVTLGCALSNIIGFMTGANLLGFVDVFFGTFATFIAAVLSWKLRNFKIAGIPILSAFPPVIANALIIGGELSWLTTGKIFSGALLFNASYVGAGQAIACFGIGLPLIKLMQKSQLVEHLIPTKN